MEISGPSKYAGQSAESILRSYFIKLRLTLAVTCCLYLAAAALCINYMFHPQQNFFFLFGTYVICLFMLTTVVKVFNFNRFQSLSYILNVDCDPVKYQKVIGKLIEKDKRHKSSASLSLEYAKSCYQLGELDEMYSHLQKVVFRKQLFYREFTKLNVWANYYFAVEDFENLERILLEIEDLKSSVKTGSNDFKNIDMLLTMMDARKVIASGTEELAREKLNLLLTISHLPIHMVSWHLELAKLDLNAGEEESAATHLQYAASAGGTTTMAVEARQLLASGR